MSRIILALCGALFLGATLVAQQSFVTPRNLRLATDSSAALKVTTVGSSGSGQSQFTTWPNLLLKTDSAGALVVTGVSGGGIGNVSGPASSTNHALAGFNGTDGKTLESETGCTYFSGNSGLTCGLFVSNGTEIVSTTVQFQNATTSSTLEALATNDYGISNNSTNGTGTFFNGGTASIASGFGTSPSISTNSTGSSGQVNVGTGGTATSGVINFAVTWSKAPFCSATVATSTAANTRAMGAVASTTQLTLTAASAWAASSLVNWTCISAR